MNRTRLLIVDDEIDLLIFYKEKLQEEGYEVNLAYSLSEAQKLLYINSYDLIILEANLRASYDFDDLCTPLYDNVYGLPVIINSRTPLTEFDNKLYSFKAYIEKSTSIMPLKERIKSLLKECTLTCPQYCTTL